MFQRGLALPIYKSVTPFLSFLALISLQLLLCSTWADRAHGSQLRKKTVISPFNPAFLVTFEIITAVIP